MWLLALSPLASAATVHLDSDAPVDVTVGDERARVTPNAAAEVPKLGEGTWRVQVTAPDGSVWAGDLALPHDAEVWLSWRAGALVLVKAGRLAGAEAVSGATKAANTVMAIGAGAQAASDVVGATSAAAGDFEAASRGEAVQSSDTNVEVTAGPGGVQSSTSRTTAGEGGVHRESTSTSIGPDGVSRDTSSTDVTLSGVSHDEDSTHVSRIEIPGDGGPAYVSLVRVDPGTPAARTGPKPKSLWYREPAALDAGGAHWTFHDPVAEAELFKLQVRVAASDRAIVWEPATASTRFDGTDVAANRAKPVVVVPGDEGRDTVVFERADGELRADAPVLALGTARAVIRGADLGLGAVDAVVGQSTGSSLVCSVKTATVSKKATSVALSCANGGTGWVWLEPSAATLVAGDTSTPNAAKKTAPVLVAPGGEEKLTVDAAIGSTVLKGATPRVGLAGVGFAADATPLDLPPMALAIDPERTADEN